MTLCVVFSSRAVKDFLSGLNIGNLDLSDPEVSLFLLLYHFCDVMFASSFLLYLFFHCILYVFCVFV